MTRTSTHSREIPRKIREAAAPYAARTRGYYQTLSATSIGLELAAAVLLGLFFGRWVDGKLGTTPWLMFVFLILGSIAGMRGVFRYVRADARANDVDDVKVVP